MYTGITFENFKFRRMKKIGLLLILFQFLVAFTAVSQTSPTFKNNTPDNDKFIIHVVSKDETFFSICKKYNIDQTELMAANPKLIHGLKTGESLNIPYHKTNETKENSQFIIHQAKKGETLYSISKIYNIPIEAIIKLNPECKDQVKENQEVRIPAVFGQAKSDEPNLLKNEEKEKINYATHTVIHGETFYSLIRQYGVTKEQLVELNPELKDGLKDGSEIKIPVVEKVSNEPSIMPNENYTEHVVEPGETLYGICAKFKVTKEEVKRLNPGLNRENLITGETILIPKSTIPSNAPVIYTGGTTNIPLSINLNKPKLNLRNSSDTFCITMFLPLFIKQTDSINHQMYVDADSLRLTDSINGVSTSMLPEDYYKNIVPTLYPPSRNFLCFYEGFLIALDSMKKTETTIRIDLFDNQNKTKVVDSVLHHSNLLYSDLIIGPVDVKQQKNISAFSNKNQIPLVSPFSSEDDYLNSNSSYYQINPTKDHILRKTADYIGKTYFNKNVIALTPAKYEQIKGGDLIETIRQKLETYAKKNDSGPVRFAKININNAGTEHNAGSDGEGYWKLKEMLKPDVENVVFIPSASNRNEREVLLSKAINSLYVLSEDFNITLIGMSEFTSFKSINPEYYHKLNLHILTPNYIDYNAPEVKSFISKFRQKYSAEPNQFSYRGYDIGMFFTKAYRTYGRNFADSISKFNGKTLQNKFMFKRVKDFAGFMNTPLYVINYAPDYTVKMISIIKE